MMPFLAPIHLSSVCLWPRRHGGHADSTQTGSWPPRIFLSVESDSRWEVNPQHQLNVDVCFCSFYQRFLKNFRSNLLRTFRVNGRTKREDRTNSGRSTRPWRTEQPSGMLSDLRRKRWDLGGIRCQAGGPSAAQTQHLPPEGTHVSPLLPLVWAAAAAAASRR